MSSSCRFDSRAQPRASTAWIPSLACALAALFAGSAARAEPRALVAASQSDSGVAVEALPSLEHAADPSAYQRVKALAVEEWNAGRWAEARALFLLAHGLKPSARTLRALGKTAFELRLYPEALRELSAALMDERQPLDPALRNETRALLQRTEAFVGRYRIQVLPSDAHLRVDGGTPAIEPDGALLLALGRHQLELEASGYVSERHEIVVADSSSQTLSFRLSPDVKPLPAPLSPQGDQSELQYHAWSLSTAGGAIALGTASLALFLRARGLDRQLQSKCKGDCDGGDTRHRNALIGTSYAALGTASICAAASAVLFLIERRRWRRDREHRQAPLNAHRRSLQLDLAAVHLRF